MKELINKIFKKIQSEGSSIIDTTFLKDNSWFYVSDSAMESKHVYIFRSGGELLISENGKIRKAHWENLIHATKSIIIDTGDEALLYNLLYLTSDYLILQQDGTDIFKVFIKQESYQAKLPRELASDPVEYIFNDIKSLLNQGNLRRLVDVEKKIRISSQEVDQHAYLPPPKPIDLTFRKYSKVGFKYFDKTEIIKHNQRIGAIRTETEKADLSIILNEKEKELIAAGMLCVNCKAENSIASGSCAVCGQLSDLS